MADERPVEEGGQAVPRASWQLVGRSIFLLLVLPLGSVGYLWQARHVSVPLREFAISPRAFPTLVGVALTAASLWVAAEYALKMLRGRGRTDPSVADGDDGPLAWRHVFFVIGLFLLYVLLVERLSYLITTPVLLILLTTFFDRGHIVRNAVLAVGFTLAIYLLFERLLEIPLP